MNHDLRKIEEMFREKFTKIILEYNDESELEITDELFWKGKNLLVPFGFIKFHLMMHDERPTLHVHLITRMDMDELYLIDDDGIKSYDMYGGQNQEIREKIRKQRRKRYMNTDCEICGELGEGYFTCPKCGRRVFDFRYRINMKRMEKKYGTRDFLKLSQEKLTFKEIITIRSFIERTDRHCGDNSTTDRCRSDGTFTNLDKRVDEIKKENQLS